VQAVVAVTLPTLFRDICLEAVRAGKPVLIEKPLATSVPDAQAMVVAAEQAGVLLMTAQTMRFDSTIVKVKEWLPRIGPLHSATMISHIEAKSSTPATAQAFGHRGALLEVGIHLLDLVRFLSGDEVSEAQCTMEPAPPAGPEISASVRLRTKKGILFGLDVARTTRGRVAYMEWIGRDGRINADWSRGLVTLALRGCPLVELVCPAQPTIQATLHAFIQAVSTGTPPPITGRDGLIAVEIADACYRSAVRQGAVLPIEFQF
jgi:predicted dehydrogenase